MYPTAVIFDFDGVIVDTEPLHFYSFQRILTPMGFNFSWEEYVQTYMGFDDRDAFREAYKAHGKSLDNENLSDLIQCKANIFLETINQGVKPYPGVVELINKLCSKNIPLAISSGAILSDILPILINLKLENCFKHIVTANDVSRSKPDPSSYILASNKLINDFAIQMTSKDRIVAIEDTPAGIASAKGAGLSVLAVTNSYPKEKLLSADRVVDSLEILLLEGF